MCRDIVDIVDRRDRLVVAGGRGIERGVISPRTRHHPDQAVGRDLTTLGYDAGTLPGASMKRRDSAHNEGPSEFAHAAELELRGVSKRYAGQQEPAIRELSFTVPAGEVCVLVTASSVAQQFVHANGLS